MNEQQTGSGIREKLLDYFIYVPCGLLTQKECIH